MASGPIASWQIDGEAMETVRDFVFLGSKITLDGDCSHEIKRYLPLGCRGPSASTEKAELEDTKAVTSSSPASSHKDP